MNLQQLGIWNLAKSLQTEENKVDQKSSFDHILYPLLFTKFADIFAKQKSSIQAKL